MNWIIALLRVLAQAMTLVVDTVMVSLNLLKAFRPALPLLLTVVGAALLLNLLEDGITYLRDEIYWYFHS